MNDLTGLTRKEALVNFLGVFDNKREVSKIKKQFKSMINGI